MVINLERKEIFFDLRFILANLQHMHQEKNIVKLGGQGGGWSIASHRVEGGV